MWEGCLVHENAGLYLSSHDHSVTKKAYSSEPGSCAYVTVGPYYLGFMDGRKEAEEWELVPRNCLASQHMQETREKVEYSPLGL